MNRTRMQRCSETGKLRYRKHIDAKIAPMNASGNGDNRQAKVETRCYRCPKCHGWHLTSMGWMS